MAQFSLTINKILYQFEADPWMPLLWVLGEKPNLTSTNFGCGLCGACPVNLTGQPLGGAGVVSVPGTVPAVCNAIFRLTGKRLRHIHISLAADK